MDGVLSSLMAKGFVSSELIVKVPNSLKKLCVNE